MFPFETDIPFLGRLELLDVYEFFDEPILFSCKNTSKNFFMVLLTETGAIQTWLCSPIDGDRLKSVQNGQIDLRTVFTDVMGGHVFAIRINREEVIVTRVSTEELKSEGLPDVDCSIQR